MIWIWLAVIVIAFVFEAVTMDLVSIWFAIGAILAFIASFISENIAVQLVVFFGSSLVLLAFTRPVAVKYLKPKS